MEQHPAGLAAPVRHDPPGAGDVRPSQALPELLRRRRKTGLNRNSAMQTVSKSVSVFPQFRPKMEESSGKGFGTYPTNCQ